jgi:methylated-DNA-protein-cysteine methyltransferase related protein
MNPSHPNQTTKQPSRSRFKQKVIDAVRAVPYGQVASYGQIALMIGIPRAARQVGWALNSLEDDLMSGKNPLPWWRIINNAGRISIKGTKYHDATLQKQKLEEEGIKVNDDLTLDIEKYRFRPAIQALKELELDDEYVQMILEKYQF